MASRVFSHLSSTSVRFTTARTSTRCCPRNDRGKTSVAHIQITYINYSLQKNLCRLSCFLAMKIEYISTPKQHINCYIYTIIKSQVLTVASDSRDIFSGFMERGTLETKKLTGAADSSLLRPLTQRRQGCAEMQPLFLSACRYNSRLIGC